MNKTGPDFADVSVLGEFDLVSFDSLPHRTEFERQDGMRGMMMESLPADEADQILADLAELMMRVKNPLLKRILKDASEQIAELLMPELDDDQTSLDAHAA
jgi:hypothetical protein